ncbi:MAG TPA: class I SAM-dependent methyltransferase, partial [Actinomycetales bacterium]|nr:class I SAM-dependent methyltransferase [Actinomycetales bacterium]
MTPEDLDFLLSDAGAELLAVAAAQDFSPGALVAATEAVRRADPVHAAAAIDVVTAR